MTTTVAPSTQALVQSVFDQITSNLAVLVNRSVHTDEASVVVTDSRVAGADQVHISFRIGFATVAEQGQGCVLVPLPDAITMGAYLLMLPDSIVSDMREQPDLDDDLKDAMLEIGNFLGGAIDEAIRSVGNAVVSVRAEGCQGVRADVRPALAYDEGSELLVGRARVRIHEFPEFEMIVMIPSFAAA